MVFTDSEVYEPSLQRLKLPTRKPVFCDKPNRKIEKRIRCYVIIDEKNQGPSCHARVDRNPVVRGPPVAGAQRSTPSTRGAGVGVLVRGSLGPHSATRRMQRRRSLGRGVGGIGQSGLSSSAVDVSGQFEDFDTTGSIAAIHWLWLRTRSSEDVEPRTVLRNSI